MHTFNHIAKILVLVLLSIAAALSVSEAIARLGYVQPWYLELADVQRSRSKLEYRSNVFGLRDRDYSEVKPSNSRRVLILGDSFSQGFGVADDSVIFPEVLEKMLNAEFSSRGMEIEILNGGIPGSFTREWVDLLLKVKDSFKPDVVLIVFFLRDGTNTNSMGSFFQAIRREVKSQDRHSFLYRHSYLFRWIQDRFDRLYLARKYSQALHVSYFGNPEQTEEWESAKRNILEIKDIATRIHAKVGLVVFPVLVELNAGYPFKDICECLMRFGAEHHMLSYSLLPAFMGKNAPDLWVSANDQHPNKKGHLIAADAILPFLRELIISSEKEREQIEI